MNVYVQQYLKTCVFGLFQDELRQARLLKKRQELRKADPHKMAALRQKFVNQAKKYFGYPYARKYWPPDCKYNFLGYQLPHIE